jgi:hypothetical protein
MDLVLWGGQAPNTRDTPTVVDSTLWSFSISEGSWKSITTNTSASMPSTVTWCGNLLWGHTATFVSNRDITLNNVYEGLSGSENDNPSSEAAWMVVVGGFCQQGQDSLNAQRVDSFNNQVFVYDFKSNIWSSEPSSANEQAARIHASSQALHDAQSGQLSLALFGNIYTIFFFLILRWTRDSTSVAVNRTRHGASASIDIEQAD